MHDVATIPEEDLHAQVRRLSAELAGAQAELARAQHALSVAQVEIARVEALAMEDPLTGLLNRRGFERDLAHAIAFIGRYESGACLLLVDLDRFKPINDELGHAAGDAALRHVAGLLVSHVRASDPVARLGGDEFAVLLWNIDERVVLQKAEALEHLTEATPCMWGGQAVPIAASTGAVLLKPDDTVAAVLDRADRAMYERKRARAALVTR